MNINEIKLKLEEYKAKFKPTETMIPLVIIAELLIQISGHLEEVSNKMYE